jgi:hypothetical protein
MSSLYSTLNFNFDTSKFGSALYLSPQAEAYLNAAPLVIPDWQKNDIANGSIVMSNYYQNPTANLPIFQLSDGGLVRLPGDPKDTKLYKFENPIDLYESLDAIELANGRRLVVSPLPAASQKLDCAPPITTIKRLLKMQKSGEQFPHFSRAQVDSLSDFIKAEVDYSLAPSLARATERLGSVAELKKVSCEQIEQCPGIQKPFAQALHQWLHRGD